MANSVYTDTEVRITDDIDDACFAVLSPLSSVTWDFGCQYNNSDIPDICGIFSRRVAAVGRRSEGLLVAGSSQSDAKVGRRLELHFGSTRPTPATRVSPPNRPLNLGRSS